MNKEEARKRIIQLKKQLKEIDYAYYVWDKPLVTDAVRDSLKDELEKLENKFPELITIDSPTQRIGGKALGKFEKHKHKIQKWSFDDLFSFEEVIEFDAKIKRFLDLPKNKSIEYLCELKIDGLNMSFIYEAGLLLKAVTRGDGLVGEVVTHNARTIYSVPLKLNKLIDIEIGGEVYMPKKSLEKLNNEQQKKQEALFANPRNAAAGTMRQLDPRVASARDLDVFMWSIYEPLKYGLKTQWEIIKKMEELGLKVNTHYKKIINIEEVLKYFEYWQKNRNKLPYEIDGIVIKVNDLKLQEKLSRTAKHVRWAAAYKFLAEQVTTIVENIEVQIGRTGVLTPVAHLRPASLAGSIVKRATLHNQDEINRLDVRIGDTVILQKAGDIIPDIVQVLPKLRTGREKKFHMPRECPVCGSIIKQKIGEVAYYCDNKNCYAQQLERLNHFVSKIAFNIDGLGPKIIEQLQRADLIKTPADLFLLTKNDLRLLERFADKSAQNLIKAIEEKKKITLAKFIYALGIRHVGEGAAIALAKNFGSIKKIQKANLMELQQVEGVGFKIAESIKSWFDEKNNQKLLDDLLINGVKIINFEKTNTDKFHDLNFVLTGELKSLSRDEAKNKIRQLGGKVSSSVSKKTDYVIVGYSPGLKYDKAKNLGIKIINEKEFLDLFDKN